MVGSYGELDGKMSYLYATRFAEVNKTLSGEQRAKLIKIRNQDVYPKGAYLYSEPIETPAVIETDFLFR